MRKKLAILIACIILFAALTACENNEPEQQISTEPPFEEETTELEPQESSIEVPQPEDLPPEQPGDSEISQPTSDSDALLAALQAFYDELTAMIERYGISLDWSETGVRYAKLVDFENDGIPELVYAIHNLTYWDGEDMQLQIPDFGNYEYVISRYYNNTVTQFMFGTVGLETREQIATGNDGISYFVSSGGEAEASWEEWFTIRDGQLMNVLSVGISFVYVVDNGEIIDIREELYINNELVGESNWDEFVETGRLQFDIVNEHSLMGYPFGITVLPLLDEIRAMIEELAS